MKSFLILLLAVPCFASGPKYVGSKTDPQIYMETQNIYHDISNPVINAGTASSMTITNATLSNATISTATISHIVGTFTNWAGYIPTVAGCGTISNVSMMWRRVGDTISVKGIFQVGTVAASALTISIPAGLSINTSLPGNQFVCGSINNSSASGIPNKYAIFYPGSGNVVDAAKGTGVALTSLNASDLLGSNTFAYVEFEVPIVGWSF